MTRQEARKIAKELTPNGFELDNLTLASVAVSNDEEGVTTEGQWCAVYIDESEPPKVMIERWPDVYTENDPYVEETDDDSVDELTE